MPETCLSHFSRKCYLSDAGKVQTIFRRLPSSSGNEQVILLGFASNMKLPQTKGETLTNDGSLPWVVSIQRKKNIHTKNITKMIARHM